MHISVVLSTYNRADVLAGALECFARQQAPSVEFEVIIVDNNSSDRTREIAEAFAARDPRFRCLFESRQGLSYARNAGIRAARADAVAFTDDDVQVAPDWIAQIHRALLEYPEADYLGGRVLPVWPSAMPDWSHAKMSPFALQDLGDRPLRLSSEDPRCLIGACLVVRSRALAKAGLFSTETQRVEDGVGSTEDADWEMQVWSYGGHGVYAPDIVVYSPLSPERLTKAYHRRWHIGHGKFHARSRRLEPENSRLCLDVPAFVYRQALLNAFECAVSTLRGNRIQAFERENSLLFCLGFMTERWKTHLLRDQPSRRPAPANSLAS
jgi:glycosyltransferase involved in cell wall biosynthesis